MSKKLLFLLLAVGLFVPVARATIKYNMLTNADGLSNSSVNCIYQDSAQMIWIGTWDGLNVYNGFGFRSYKFEPDNANTITNNIIRNIAEESEGVIWASTDYGINRIDVKNDRIERFYPGYEQNSPTAERVFSVAATEDGVVFCVATGWGIACYDKPLKRLAALNVPNFNTSEIRSVVAAGASSLLLHTVHDGLVRIRYAVVATGNVEVREKTELFPAGGIRSVFDCRTAIYMAAPDGGVYKYDSASGKSSFLGKIPPPLGRGACSNPIFR